MLEAGYMVNMEINWQDVMTIYKAMIAAAEESQK
tara:strand:+ start:179 stop:280 length:102 start_codon:yes stop_codon:yes gene_type:complete